MRRPEFSGRWRLAVRAAVFLCLAPVAAGARTSALPIQEIGVSATSSAAAQPRPGIDGPAFFYGQRDLFDVLLVLCDGSASAYQSYR